MPEIKISDALWYLKERLSKDVGSIMNREPLLHNKIKKAVDAEWDGEGKYFRVPIQLEGGQSQGFYAEGEILPDSEPQVGDNFLIYPKSCAFTVRVTRQNLLAVKQGLGAFFNGKAKEVTENTLSLREKMARAFGGTGMGVLGTLSGVAVVAGGNSTLPFSTDTNMQHFRKGMRVDVWAPAYPVVTRRRLGNPSAAADNTTFDRGWKILDVNRPQRTIVVQGDINAGGGAQNPIAGDYVMPQNEGINLNGATGNLATGKEYAGLEYLFSTGQYWTAIQGLSYANNTELQSPRSTAGAPRPLTPILMQRFSDAIRIASGMTPNFHWMDFDQKNLLLEAGLQDVRHVSEKVKLGITEFTWNGKDLVADRQAPPGKICLANLEALGRVEMAPLGPMDGSMGERLPRYAIQEWAFGADENLFVRQPNAGGWVENLALS